MCGITGIINLSQEPVSSAVLEKMTNKLFHRGPDDFGLFIDKNVGFGFRRLSILDLSIEGHQPMHSADQNICLIFNGEIYNYKELRTMLKQRGYQFRSGTDSEVIIYCYEEFGDKCLDYLDGMFAFAIYDKRKESVLIARDRFGIKPLVFYHYNNQFIFGSEIKAILAHPGVDQSININAISDYFSNCYIAAPQTIYKHISKLPPSYYIRIDVKKNVITYHNYYQISSEVDESRSEESWIEEVREKFFGAVKTHFNSDVPVGVLLSGGLDSSSIVAASKELNFDFKTFSISFPNNEDFNELHYQNIVKNKFGTEHYDYEPTEKMIKDVTPQIIKGFDEPFAVNSVFPLYLISKYAKDYVKVLLSGDGGDEVFLGYVEHYKKLKTLSLLNQLPKMSFLGKQIINRTSVGDFSSFQRKANKIRKFLSADESPLFHSFFERFGPELKGYLFGKELNSGLGNLEVTIDSRFPNYSKYNTDWYTSDFHHRVHDEMLAKTDKCTSLNSLEGRTPFLDKGLVETAFRMPQIYKHDDKVGKKVFRKAMHGYLPDDVIYRRKQGFNFPVSQWIDTEIFDDLLNTKNSFLDLTNVKNLISYYKKNDQNLGSHLFVLYQFLYWQNIYNEGL